MNKIFHFSLLQDDCLDPLLTKRINEQLSSRFTTVFEVCDDFLLIQFHWYHLKNKPNKKSRVLLFLNREHLLIFIEDNRLRNEMQTRLQTYTNRNAANALSLFFTHLLNDDMEMIDAFEKTITEAEDHALLDSNKDYSNKIILFRKHLLQLKHYYNQLQVIFDGLLENENGLFDEETLRKLTILHNRIDHLQMNVSTLRDYVTQMREAYQAQVDIEQNNIMKIFTLITAIFLPLTLMVGWYGMNFKYMYELDSIYSYPIFILVSIFVCLILIIYFKKRRWF